jgi:hypothetical protein
MGLLLALCRNRFFSSLEEEKLFLQKNSGLKLGCFSGLGLEMALGCVEKCRKMSKKVD